METEAESGLREPVGRSMLLAMKFVTSITRDEDGMWIVECPAIPGCVGQGNTRAEALENAREAIAACLEVRAERGMPLTVETEELEVVA
jgi:predicted RNase H-like HicB family nuclease